ncbi:SubName: Full=Uncharacterized protein {ECO:0000313/EMBL:CCA67948.1} [Serendipita indica DSM 11827]|uniref:Uncharacterized protein n=1 Tax=Serendipita indica (strain DSM 11827) TaxID=1109443 RepID=G4T9B1_SERID|nr:SubName: Full=Uncharacterized protein {ECO:0000313/EMBL:CCA67948.1} [Serendipita indica DSM 11827]CCA67948.1 hypothetical protein PIIN_01816 [Serendipita indica DSM 11827]
MALPPTPNPILAVTLPIVLDKPPGTHAPTEALRLALLGVGAVHMAYLSSRRRVCVGVGAVGPTDVVSPMGVSADLVGGESDAARMMGLSSMLRLGATRCLAVACRNPEETRSDAALGATMAVTLIDIFSGGHQWTRNINLAKTLIALRGGPATILNTNLPKQARFGGGVTVSPARFWLEMLAVYETFGSLTSGEEPTLLAPGNTDWWFDAADQSYHANSIEKVFGMARSMVTLIAKVSAFLCRTIRERAFITENEPIEGASIVQIPDAPPEMEIAASPEEVVGATAATAEGEIMLPDFDFEKFLNDFGATPSGFGEGFITGPIPPSESGGPAAAALTPRFDDGMSMPTPALPALGITMDSLPSSGAGEAFTFEAPATEPGEQEGNPALDQARMSSLRAFFKDAKALYAEIESWEDPIGHENREARVLVGNKTHKLALMIIMLRDVFHVSRMDPRVQAFAASILDLCLESSQQNMGVDLTWPVIIAGCQVVTANARIQVAQAFDSFRKQCCFEIESSERIVAEVWRRVDNNEPRDDWRAVVEDENLRILVL